MFLTYALYMVQLVEKKLDGYQFAPKDRIGVLPDRERQ
jgi:hypothetical protein